MKFEQSKYKGYYIVPKSDSANVRKTPNGPLIKNVKKGKACGVATGRFVKDGNNAWYEMYFGNTQAELLKKQIGFSHSSVINVTLKHPGGSSSSSSTSSSGSETGSNFATEAAKTERLLFDIINTDKKTVENLINAYRLALEYKRRGVAVPHKYVMSFFNIWSSVAARRDYIANHPNLQITKGSPMAHPVSFKAFEEFAEKGMSDIGAIPIVIWIVIGIISTAATAAGTIYVWEQFQPKYDASKVNLKQSEELKKVLADVDPEVRDQILEDLEGQLDDAYYAGLREGTWKGRLNIGKPVIYALGGFLLISWFMNRKQQKG